MSLPPFASHRFANGLGLDVARMTGTPDVAIRLVVDAGAGTTAADLGGLAALAGDALSAGAGGRSAPEMARWIDGIGAAFRVRTTYDAAVLSMHAMNDQLEASLAYLSAVTRRPDFEPDEVDRRRSLLLDRLRRRRDDPSEIAAEALDEALFGVHPYGVPLSGTPASVEGIDARDLSVFWRRRVRPGTATLIVCGEVDPDGVRDLVAREFGDWEATELQEEDNPPTPIVGRPAVRAGEVLLLDRPRSRQTELRLGGIGLARGEDDEIETPALVMNAILGGLFNSRINLNLREDKGWTYGARSLFVRRRLPGPFILRTAVATEASAPAFEEVLREIAAMRSELPTDDEMTLAANALTLSMPLQFQTATQLASRRAEAVTYGLPEDYWERFPRLVRAVTAEQVREAARRFLRPEDLVLLAVGDLSGVADELGSLGRVALTAAEA
ncbi:MAG: M16 family metallopeptidase [Gemmatimonadota bacterium]